MRLLIAKGLMLFNSHFRSLNTDLFYRFNYQIINGTIKLFANAMITTSNKVHVYTPIVCCGPIIQDEMSRKIAARDRPPKRRR